MKGKGRLVIIIEIILIIILTIVLIVLITRKDKQNTSEIPTTTEEVMGITEKVDEETTTSSIEETTTTTTNETTTTTTTTTTSTTKETTTKKSYEGYFNLNNNIKVGEIVSGCGKRLFAKNYYDVYRDFERDRSNGIYHTEEEYDARFSQLIFDSREQSVLNLFKKLESNPGPGLYKVEYEYTNHLFGETFYELYTVDDDLNEIDPLWRLSSNTNLATLHSYLSEAIFYDGTYNGEFSCGSGGPGEILILNEQLCNKYHLKCDRW